ncbi:Cof-type HAD-IIB family hydrolase [Alteribacter natronophilus]|uniref:Cof-type HAD-IIB family hydrolase n=1 Tax=Alteribacter natronophilus TaxID=2583810 RepID=UPI00110E751C|nr:Cof-type HAD-IIB family hydrolase [Alteribacter natronophilus]TMW73389.1 HAD family phosphatase [Alteribacter natronophilus]
MMFPEKKIKLIALDMDGTLLGSNMDVSPENAESIKRAHEHGIEVVLSTGRMMLTAGKYAEDLGLKSYLVTVNGSEVWHTDGSLVDRQLLDVEFMELMRDLTDEHKTHFWAASVDKVWNAELPEKLDEYEWMKFGFDVEDDEVREKIRAVLSGKEGLEISNSSLKNLEINAAGINKAAALKKVCNRLGITMDEVMAVGDSLNDLAMIKEAGIGVAMGNAQDFVKEHADFVTSSNLEHGVAQAIDLAIRAGR